MKHIFYATTLLGLLALTSCATIFTKSAYPVRFNSDPQGARITITNKAGRIIYTGETPAKVKLKAAAGYMSREEYTIEFAKEGYDSKITYLTANLDGVYFANLLLGGFIGMLIVDPASGAMYKIADKEINEQLKPKQAEITDLLIYDIDNLPENLTKEDLVLLQ